MTILAFDQSYTNIGYSICRDGELIKSGSFKLENLKVNAIKRAFIWGLAKGLKMCYSPDKIICEQIRLKNSFGINLNAITSLSEISSVICDAAFPQEVYTADSRSWKAKILKNANAKKEESVAFVKEKYKMDVDHDWADAICIGLYPFEKKCLLNLYE